MDLVSVNILCFLKGLKFMKALETYTCKYNTLFYSTPITFKNVEISLEYELSNALSVKYMVPELWLFVGFFFSILILTP